MWRTRSGPRCGSYHFRHVQLAGCEVVCLISRVMGRLAFRKNISDTGACEDRLTARRMAASTRSRSRISASSAAPIQTLCSAGSHPNSIASILNDPSSSCESQRSTICRRIRLPKGCIRKAWRKLHLTSPLRDLFQPRRSRRPSKFLLIRSFFIIGVVGGFIGT